MISQVTDYRTAVSGVRPEDLAGAPTFKQVQTEVAELIKDRILVGHAIHHDFKVLKENELIKNFSKISRFFSSITLKSLFVTLQNTNLSEQLLVVGLLVSFLAWPGLDWTDSRHIFRFESSHGEIPRCEGSDGRTQLCPGQSGRH